jgi:hypothetical protein
MSRRQDMLLKSVTCPVLKSDQRVISPTSEYGTGGGRGPDSSPVVPGVEGTDAARLLASFKIPRACAEQHAWKCKGGQ